MSADPVTTTYTAESLEDIAREFDRRASLSGAESDRARTIAVKSWANGERYTWMEAARILRATKLKGL